MIKRGFYTDSSGEKFFVQGFVEIINPNGSYTKGVLFHTLKDKPRIFQAMPEGMFLNDFTEGLHEGRIGSIKSPSKKTAKSVSKTLFSKAKTFVELATSKDSILKEFPEGEKDQYFLANYHTAYNRIKLKIKKDAEKAKRGKKNANN